MAGPRSWKLLAVDNDPAQRQLVAAVFRKTPAIDVVTVPDGESALATVSQTAPDIVLLDLCVPGMGGLELLQKLKILAPRIPIAVITATDDVRTAVEAIQLGAYQFLTKPLNQQELVVIVKRALERSELLAEVETLRHRADGDDPLAARFGASPPMRLVARQIRQVAASHFMVLVQGQEGASPTSLREIAEAAVEAAEREAILRALQSSKGNKSQAARLLHVDFKTLHLKMRRYGITISHHAEA